MAERRMFAKTIIDSDAFLDMPLSAQALYFHLSMRADDDGFVNSPRKIQRVISASDDDLRILIGKKFIIPFESGIVVIKHWRLHNYIQKDRYKETIYTEEKSLLMLEENNVYSLDTEWIQDVYGLETQDSIGKYSIDEVSQGKDSLGEDSNCLPPSVPPSRGETVKFVPPTLEEVSRYLTDRGSTIDPVLFWNYYESVGWMRGKNKIKDWKRCVTTWEKKEQEKQKKPKTKFQNFDERTYNASDLTALEEAMMRH